MSKSVRWDVVSVAVPVNFELDLIESELEFYRQTGLLNTEDLVITRDPCDDIGSAGSALNALLVAAEFVCARKDLTVLNEDVVQNSLILVILVGSPNCLLSDKNGGKSNLLRNILSMNTIVGTVSKGTFIIGTDSSFDIKSTTLQNYIHMENICAFSFNLPESSLEKDHGSYICDNKDKLVNISYQDGHFKNENIIVALFYFPSQVTTTFLSLHSCYPLSATTYHGLDTGNVGMKLSLFFDILLSTAISYQDFMQDEHGKDKIEINSKLRQDGRQIIYQRLSNFNTSIVNIPLDNYSYHAPSHHDYNVTRDQIWKNRYVWIEDIHQKLTDLSRGFSRDLYKKVLAIEKCYKEPIFEKVLDHYHERLSKNPSTTISQSACIFSRTADIMSNVANGKGGLRSGPASNPSFVKYFKLVKNDDIENLNEHLSQVFLLLRNEWSQSPSLLIRGARHADALVQLLISRLVMERCSVVNEISFDKREQPSPQHLYAPGRIDLFGGWLDTPPITFDISNPCVINAAVLVDNEFPLSSRIDFLESDTAKVVLKLGEKQISLTSVEEILELHDKPSLPGSLLCACLVATVIHDHQDLEEILMKNFHTRAISIECFSSLPHGSGLGTSSIVAGCIIKTIYASMGFFDVPEEHIVFTVLKVEQLLTTGGGWQDQIGGMYPGIKCGSLSRTHYNVETLKLKDDFVEEINNRLVLIYTGTTRLAKNLLQEVIRGWYADEEVRESLCEMEEKVTLFKESMLEGVIPKDLIQLYYSIKQKLAPGCEPEAIASLRELLNTSNISDCCWLTGAGGGGFLCVYLNEGKTIDDVRQLLTDRSHLSVHSVTLWTG